ncbi:MAG TPA: S8 family serine peptidase, partial [Ignavibacteriaceae bacterium]|nr:S8 family serine peptidase [Ignavibacteriaceae bacterium]
RNKSGDQNWTYDSWAINGINWAVDPNGDGNTSDGADVLSNSWSGGEPNDALTNAINNAATYGRGGKGCVVVFSAGNGNTSVYYPAYLDNVIAVGATDQNDAKWNYSNYGSALDIVAPSGDVNLQGDIWTTDIMGTSGYSTGNYTGLFGGTSAACPLVSGLAALILSQQTDLTGSQVKQVIELTAKDLGSSGRDDYYGWGRIDAWNALRMTTSGTLPEKEVWRGTLNITGNVTVPSGIKLTILPETIVNFSSGTSLIVEGTLIADGATFTSPVGTPWRGIKLYYSDNSSIQNCTIENFGPGYGSDGIYIEGGWWPLIENNTIDGIYNGIKLYGTNATIRNNTISFCSNGNGITVEGGSSAIISGNTINNNYYHGISVYSNSTGYVEVYENYLRNNGYITHQYTGIRTYNSAITAYKNKVSNSAIGYFAQSYSEMDFGSDYGPYAFMQNNLADGCSDGLVAYDNSTIIAGQYNYATGSYLADHNSIRNISGYLLSAGNTSTIYAQNDWLGSYPPNEAKINNDASSYVYWEPYLSSDPLPPLKMGSPSFNENELALINARSLIKKGSYTEAKQILKDLIDKKSINRAVNPLLRLYYKSKDPEIKTYLENLVSKVKDRDASNIYKGALSSIYYEDKEYDKALKLIEEQISSGKEKAIIDKYLVYALGIRDNNSALKILDDINGKL